MHYIRAIEHDLPITTLPVTGVGSTPMTVKIFQADYVDAEARVDRKGVIYTCRVGVRRSWDGTAGVVSISVWPASDDPSKKLIPTQTRAIEAVKEWWTGEISSRVDEIAAVLDEPAYAVRRDEVRTFFEKTLEPLVRGFVVAVDRLRRYAMEAGVDRNLSSTGSLGNVETEIGATRARIETAVAVLNAAYGVYVDAARVVYDLSEDLEPDMQYMVRGIN